MRWTSVRCSYAVVEGGGHSYRGGISRTHGIGSRLTRQVSISAQTRAYHSEEQGAGAFHPPSTMPRCHDAGQQPA